TSASHSLDNCGLSAVVVSRNIANRSPQEEPSMRTATFDVGGMLSMLDYQGVEKQIGRMAGVRRVTAKIACGGWRAGGQGDGDHRGVKKKKTRRRGFPGGGGAPPPTPRHPPPPPRPTRRKAREARAGSARDADSARHGA